MALCFYPDAQFVDEDSNDTKCDKTISKIKNSKGENIADMKENIISDMVKTNTVNKIADCSTNDDGKTKTR